MSTISTIQNTNYQNINYIQIITNQEITNISTRVSCPLNADSWFTDITCLLSSLGTTNWLKLRPVFVSWCFR